ncbi:MAG: hypothetical protein FWG87_10225 [Defluviitaleaceae bacterium]|nr:hypothetical protein [Defluviitaleaceae bacterium]
MLVRLLRLRGDIPTKPLMFCERRTSTKFGEKGLCPPRIGSRGSVSCLHASPSLSL